MYRIFPACFEEISPLDAIKESAKVVFPNTVQIHRNRKMNDTVINMSQDADVAEILGFLLERRKGAGVD